MLETSPEQIAPYARLRDSMVEQLSLDKETATELIRLELGFRLWEQLGLHHQPVTGLASLLTGQPFPSLQTLPAEQRHALYVTMNLLQYGQHAWKAAIRDYMTQPAGVRMYRISSDFMVQSEPNSAYDRSKRLDAILRVPLALHDFTNSGSRYKTADAESVRFRHPMLEHNVIASIPPELHAAAARASEVLPRLPDADRKRTPIKATRRQLETTAQWLEEREAALGLSSGNWVQRFNEVIRYQTYDPVSHKVGEVNAEDVVIDGLLHVAGIVGGGKSTLAKLLAVLGSGCPDKAAEGVLDPNGRCIAQHQWRTVLVVGNNTIALEWAHWFNSILAQDRATPAATVIFGQSGRAQNLGKVARIGDLSHWGHRWLDPGCLLQGRATQLEELLEVVPVGQEPCGYVEQRGSRGRWVPRTCPLWSLCPSRQMYRDIPTTTIWITTVAALMKSRLPSQLDSRRLYISELVHHYADLVVFDEIDSDQQWVDDLYAPQSPMINQRPGHPREGSGLVPILDRGNAAWMDTPQRTVTRQRLQWAAAFEGLISHLVCTLLEEEISLQEFAGQKGYFTAAVLFRELAREVAIATGDLVLTGDRKTESQESYRKLADFLGSFHLNSHYLDPEIGNGNSLEQRLYLIAQAMATAPDTLWRGNSTHDLCIQWLRDALAEFSLGTVPETELSELARKLELGLAVSLLSYYHYKAHNRHIDLPEGFAKIEGAPSPFLRLLPDAPLGVAYGFRYGGDRSEKAADAPTATLPPRKLESFRYEAVGRMHLLRMPYLLEALGYDGPNVLAMSGTSWVQYSAKHHFAVAPQAILAPNDMTERALKESRFEFHPLGDPEDDHRAVRISGSGRIDRQMVRAMELLALHPTQERSDLRRVIIKRLKDNAREDPDRWDNRQRILIFTNSYAQAKLCAIRIGGSYPDWTVLYLQRGETNDPRNWQHVPGTQPYPRDHIEAFGHHGNRTLLFAPLLTVGRRYNILNLSRVAAFGAVIFAVRPMSPPGDQADAIHWINYRALEIYNDPTHDVWQASTYEDQLNALRKHMLKEWYAATTSRRGFGTDNAERFNNDTAATMIASIVQACGRLLRGAVPFDAYFIDAAWAPRTAYGGGPDTAQTSVLVRMNRLLEEYCREPLGRALFSAFHQPFKAMIQSLTTTEGPIEGDLGEIQ